MLRIIPVYKPKWTDSEPSPRQMIYWQVWHVWLTMDRHASISNDNFYVREKNQCQSMTTKNCHSNGNLRESVLSNEQLSVPATSSIAITGSSVILRAATTNNKTKCVASQIRYADMCKASVHYRWTNHSMDQQCCMNASANRRVIFQRFWPATQLNFYQKQSITHSTL